jgi:hypothetical protein
MRCSWQPEVLIAGCQDIVDQYQLWTAVQRNRDGQAEGHARGVSPHRFLEIVPMESTQCKDVVLTRTDLGPGEAK